MKQRVTASLALVALLLGFVGVAPAPAADPVDVHVVLSLTGGAAFLGKAEQQSIQLIERITNERGGIGGRPLHFVVADDQSSPQMAVQITNGILAKNVPILLGSDLTAPCAAMMPLVEKSGPTMYCFSPGINPPAGGYVFSASAATRADAIALVRYFRLRGWTRLGVITSTDASGQAFETSFDRALALPENKTVEAVDRQHFQTADLSIAGQAAHLKAANPQAIICWTTGTPFGTLLRGLHDVGYDGPVAGGNGNMNYAQLKQYGAFLPHELYFPGKPALAAGTPPGPIRDAQSVYFKAFDTIGVHPDLGNNIAWDPTLIVVQALQKLGPNARPDQFRDYLLNFHGWTGVNGVYDFRDGEQRGIGINSIIMDRWDPDNVRFIAVSRPGGYLK